MMRSNIFVCVKSSIALVHHQHLATSDSTIMLLLLNFVHSKTVAQTTEVMIGIKFDDQKRLYFEVRSVNMRKKLYNKKKVFFSLKKKTTKATSNRQVK